MAASSYTERVHELVRRIPPGRVMSYGRVAAALEEGSARAVGRAMFQAGDGVPWHRVVMADGSPKPFAADEHLARLDDDGTPLTPDGRRVDMSRARWSP
ncbi:MAG: MGMT family protein [Frankia sp.]|nr:MGMT family protein [Frankia sp.]